MILTSKLRLSKMFLTVHVEHLSTRSGWLSSLLCLASNFTSCNLLQGSGRGDMFGGNLGYVAGEHFREVVG